MSKVRINVGVALEGTAAGAIERAKFAGVIATYEGYRALLDFTQHAVVCPKSQITIVVGDLRYETSHMKTAPRGKNCTCGLDQLLRGAIPSEYP